jgi:hypothetical protein
MLQKKQALSGPPDLNKHFRPRSDRITLVITVLLVVLWVLLLISMSLVNSHAAYSKVSGEDHPRDQTPVMHHTT